MLLPAAPWASPQGDRVTPHAMLPAMQAGTWLLPYSWDWPAASPHPSLAAWLLLGRVTPGGRKVGALRLHQHTEERSSALCDPGMGSGGGTARVELSILGDLQCSNHTQH